ncbi:hypothetical protein GGTG_07539 [Gaeumannomyces tritici R3-111a-1]|uniref:Peptidase M43 pregnancy-associated plasma-A domain-containing protein n=1 Tax=Gaeumannomyces tritici (strain R3-111a-1) TaxID=644352 RepID=J3P1Z1_GAET3|nr:hypothetical protein GGTG_07539 [Gaeumannomyces tritici R3-111a-1]EJT73683.1 hypothetical protein GGTG_07539 [Gaeumannomyces tritici R3-111a-1]
MRLSSWTLLLAGGLVAAQSPGTAATTALTSRAPSATPSSVPTSPSGGSGQATASVPGGGASTFAGSGSGTRVSSANGSGATRAPTGTSSPTGTSARGTGTDTSSSDASEPTGGTDDESEITIATNGGENESDKPPPAEDVSTAEGDAAEEQENRPEVKMTPEQAREVAVLETGMFEHFVNTAPAPGDTEAPGGALVIPQNVSQSCTISRKAKRGLWGMDLLGPAGVSDLVDMGPISPRQLLGDCRYVTSLQIDVHVHYMRPFYYKDPVDAKGKKVDPQALKQIVKNQFKLMNDKIYGPMGITFNLKGDVTYWNPPKKGSNSDWSLIKKNEARLEQWQKQTYFKNKAVLTLWLVNELARADGDKALAGYARFPQDLAKSGFRDGVVMEAGLMPLTKPSTTLIHEIGHWMGLYHTFYATVDKPEDDCKKGDGLLDTTLTRGLKSIAKQCEQVYCNSKDNVKRKVLNWMSYSSCRGSVLEKGFTSDQKAAMFARYISMRREYLAGECRYKDPKAAGVQRLAIRSSMQDLVDGKCPDIDKQVDALVNQKTNAAAAAAPPSLIAVAVVVGWAVLGLAM